MVVRSLPLPFQPLTWVEPSTARRKNIDFELSCLPGWGVVSYTVVIEEWNQQLTTADPLRILLITETASEPLGLTVAAVAGRE